MNPREIHLEFFAHLLLTSFQGIVGVYSISVRMYWMQSSGFEVFFPLYLGVSATADSQQLFLPTTQKICYPASGW